jgi:molecular chaperone GrpE (heat shock protein)
MWQKLFSLFRRKTPPRDANESQEILQEVRQDMQAVKKLLRKHGILLEKMREEFIDHNEQERRQELTPLLAFADAFFYLDRSFQETMDLSPQRRQALDMVWQKLDQLLATAEIRMVRQVNVPFNEYLHEAVENLAPEGWQPEVLGVVQPGYVHDGRVARAARVIVGRALDNNRYSSEEPMDDEEYHLRD